MAAGNRQATSGAQAARQSWMGVLAKADFNELSALWEAVAEKPDWRYLRRPETGMVMVRARAGGDGEQFNMGEMTVTRCSVCLAGDVETIGHGYVAGRNPRHAEIAAVVDALMQQPARRATLQECLIEPLQRDAEERRQREARKTAATKVEFFALARERV
jgi:alpha-D-ribose 1-methylphosphonate 5-triphosphate synthase subunit PhnG